MIAHVWKGAVRRADADIEAAVLYPEDEIADHVEPGPGR